MVGLVVDAPRVVNRDARGWSLKGLMNDSRIRSVKSAINSSVTTSKQNSIKPLLIQFLQFSWWRRAMSQAPLCTVHIHIPAEPPRLPASRDRRLTLKISVRRDRASFRTPLRARPFAGIGGVVAAFGGSTSTPTTVIHWHRHTHTHTHATARWTWLDGYTYI